MAVIMVREIFVGRDALFAKFGDNTISRVFKLKTNNAQDDGPVLFNSGLLPVYASVHPNRPGMYARRYRIAQSDQSAFMWEVIVEYDDHSDAAQLPQFAQEIQPIPLLRRVKIEGTSVHRTVPMTAAPLVSTSTIAAFNDGVGVAIPATKSPVQTSSYEAIEGATMADDQFAWHVTWNVAVIPFWIADYQNCINQGPVNVRGVLIPARKLKLSAFKHSDLLEEKPTPYVTYGYYQIQFELHYSRTGWFAGFPDMGFMKLVSGAQKEILLGDDSKPSKPVPLDGAGAVLASPTLATIVYRWFAPHPEKDFSVFPLV